MKKLITLVALFLAFLILSCSAMAYTVTLQDIETMANKDINSMNAMYSSELEMVIVSINSYEHYMLLGFELVGQDKDIISAKLYSDTEFYKVTNAEYYSALVACNQWNYDHRYPTAYVSPESNQIMADNFLYLTENVTREMVEEFVSNQIFGCKQFIRYLRDQNLQAYKDL